MKIKKEDTIKQLCILFESIKDLPFTYSIGIKQFSKYEGKTMFDHFPEVSKYVSLRHRIFTRCQWSMRYKCIINTETRTFSIMHNNIPLKSKTSLHKLNEKVIRETHDTFLERVNQVLLTPGF